jgi:hypothetical protein
MYEEWNQTLQSAIKSTAVYATITDVTKIETVAGGSDQSRLFS